MSIYDLQDSGMNVMCKTGQDGCFSTTTNVTYVITNTTDTTTATTTTITSTNIVVEKACGNLLEANTTYKNAPKVKNIKDGSITDFNSCAEECANFEGCLFWTFTRYGNCYLRSSDYGREFKQGYTAGQKPCN